MMALFDAGNRLFRASFNFLTYTYLPYILAEFRLGAGAASAEKPADGLTKMHFPYASSRFTNVNRLCYTEGWVILARSFFEPFGMCCPLDQIHRTRKSIPHCC